MGPYEKQNLKSMLRRAWAVFSKVRLNLIYILVTFLAFYLFLSFVFYYPFAYLEYVVFIDDLSDSVIYILDVYGWTITSYASLFVVTWLFRPGRYIWKSFLLPRKYKAELTESDVLAEFYGRSRNGFKPLLRGFLIGFVTVGIPIVCALLHGDISLYFEAQASQIPLFAFALLCVFVQSTSEELWCRTYLYQRLHERYPLWVAVAVNGVLFGALHSFNDGVTFFSVLEIAVCGISYSLVRWYSGNVWIAMGMHTGWNFFQAIVFGLPNSGMAAEVSLFHLNASNAVSNLIYDQDFGVEGAIPAFVMDLLLGVVVLVLAARSGRLKELKWNCSQTMAMQTAANVPADEGPAETGE